MTRHTWADFGIELRGQATKIPCPRCKASGHNGATNLSISHQRGMWMCHRAGCGFKGSLDAGDTSGGTRGAPVFRDTSAPKKEYTRPKPLPRRTQEEKPKHKAEAFFASRGISQATLDKACVTWAKSWMPQFRDEGDQDCIIFPYYRIEYDDDGNPHKRLVNAKYRGPQKDGKKTFRMETGAELTFWNLDRCEGADTIVICEGEMDGLACMEAGIDHVLSVPNGAVDENDDGTMPRLNLDYIASGLDLFEFADKIIIATDGDRPGTTLAGELSRRIGREKCYRVKYPDGCKDLNDVLMNLGPSMVNAVVDNAQPYPIEGVFSPTVLRDRIVHVAHFGYEVGVNPGWDNVAALYTPQPGGVTVVTGIPSMGKSTFVDAMFLNIAMSSDWTFAIYSPEMHPPEKHMGAQLERLYGKPLDRTTGMAHITDDEIDRGIEDLGRWFWIIDPHERQLDEILARARMLVTRSGIKGLLIDPFTMLRKPERIDERDFIWECLVKIEDFARRYGVHIWIVAHPTKMESWIDEETGKIKYAVPGPYNISGAAHWANFPDFCLTVHIEDGRTQIHVTKVRDSGLYGKKGVAELDFDPISRRFTEHRPRHQRRAAA